MICTTERNGKKTPFGINGPLHIEGTSLTGSNGKPVQLRGLSTHNLNNYPEYVNIDAIRQFADEWGISVFRLAMYSGAADGFDGYADGDDAHRTMLEDLILKGVRYAAELGIYVIVDWHILLDSDPNIHADMAEHFFKSICPKLKAYDNVLYEICNEPNVGADWDAIKRYSDRIIPVIRGIDPDKVIIVGTPNWSQEVDKPAADPLPYKNIAYTLHFYADTHRDELRSKMDKAIEAGICVFISEFGVCDAAGSGAINREQTDLWMEAAKKHNTSYVAWNLSNKDETSAFLKPSCDKLSDWTEDDYSEGGKYVKKCMLLP